MEGLKTKNWIKIFLANLGQASFWGLVLKGFKDGFLDWFVVYWLYELVSTVSHIIYEINQYLQRGDVLAVVFGLPQNLYWLKSQQNEHKIQKHILLFNQLILTKGVNSISLFVHCFLSNNWSELRLTSIYLFTHQTH